MAEHYIKRPAYSGALKATVKKNANILQRDDNGNIVSPNGTGLIINEETPVDGGHRSGYEFRYQKKFAEQVGMSQENFNSPNMFGNPSLYQVEPRCENLSGLYEEHNSAQGSANVAMYAAYQDPDIKARIYVEQNENSDTVFCRTSDGELEELYTLPHENKISGLTEAVNKDEVDYTHGCDSKAIDFSDCHSESSTYISEYSDEYSYTH